MFSYLFSWGEDDSLLGTGEARPGTVNPVRREVHFDQPLFPFTNLTYSAEEIRRSAPPGTVSPDDTHSVEDIRSTSARPGTVSPIRREFHDDQPMPSLSDTEHSMLGSRSPLQQGRIFRLRSARPAVTRENVDRGNIPAPKVHAAFDQLDQRDLAHRTNNVGQTRVGGNLDLPFQRELNNAGQTRLGGSFTVPSCNQDVRSHVSRSTFDKLDPRGLAHRTNNVEQVVPGGSTSFDLSSYESVFEQEFQQSLQDHSKDGQAVAGASLTENVRPFNRGNPRVCLRSYESFADVDQLDQRTLADHTTNGQAVAGASLSASVLPFGNIRPTPKVQSKSDESRALDSKSKVQHISHNRPPPPSDVPAPMELLRGEEQAPVIDDASDMIAVEFSFTVPECEPGGRLQVVSPDGCKLVVKLPLNALPGDTVFMSRQEEGTWILDHLSRPEAEVETGSNYYPSGDPIRAALNCESFVNVTMLTTKGNLNLSIVPRWAPLGARRFLEMVDKGFYSQQVAIYRVLPGFCVQFGVVRGLRDQQRFDAIQDDPPVGVPVEIGSVAFVPSGPDSRRHTLCIYLHDFPSLLNMPSKGPIGRVSDMESLRTVESFYSDYGDAPQAGGSGPDPAILQERGNEYIRTEFPLCDFITSARRTSDHV